METPPNKLHPMILVAATAVTVTSLAALAALVGWLPVGHDAPATPAPLAMQVPAQTPAPVAVAPQAPTAASGKSDSATQNIPSGSSTMAKPATEHRPTHASAPRHAAGPVSDSLPPPPPPTRGATPVSTGYANDNGIYVEDSRAARPAQAAQCRDCGTIESVREVKQEAQGTGLGAVAGTLLGGVVGNQMGKGHGNTAMTVLGAVGGAFAGNEVEKNVRGTKQYEIGVRLDDGNTRVITQSQAPIWHNGDRVRIVNGAIAPL